MAVVARQRAREVRLGFFELSFSRFFFSFFQVDLPPRRARNEGQAAGGARGLIWKGAGGTLETEEEEEEDLVESVTQTHTKKTKNSPTRAMSRFKDPASSECSSSGCSCSSESEREGREAAAMTRPVSPPRQQSPTRAAAGVARPPTATTATTTTSPRPLHSAPLSPPASSPQRGMSANEFRDALHARMVRSGMLDDVKVNE